MIEGIDIFEPRENGLPDFTKISPAQIFNGSIAASKISMEDGGDPLGLLKEKGYSGSGDTTIDPSTGKRVEVRRAVVVDELLNGGSAKARGHRPVNAPRTRSGGSNYYAPAAPPPDLPDNPSPMDPEGSILLPPPDLTPEEEKTSYLRKLPVMLLEELKNLHMV